MLEELRESRDLSRSEMIELLGITKSYYSMLISGERKISKKLALRLKDEFGVSLDNIFFADNVHISTTKSRKSKRMEAM